MRLKTRLLCASMVATVGAAALPVGGALAQTTPASQQMVRLDIPAGPASAGLNALATQADVQIFYPFALVSERTIPGMQGEYAREEAIRMVAEAAGLVVARREGDAYALQQPGEGGSSPQSTSASDGNAVEALIVTAQKKEEQIQDVPIAISAFTQKSLDAQKIEGGFDLLKAIPNVTFSKSNFSGYNFSIRGIGTKAISATTDPGVAVAFNNSTLIVNRLFEQEYFDVERVEVLRGPQGTLYGRNATSGVINVISARPRLMEFEGDIELEAGNYNAQRLRGMVNVPVGDTLAVRFAGSMTKRDGYGYNEAADDPDVLVDVASDVDDRDLWSARLTVGWEPIEQIRVNALWERFEEDDRRVRTSKQLCHRDPGPAASGAWDWENAPVSFKNINQRNLLSQGCLPGSLYDDGAFGTVNGASLPFVAAFWLAPELSQASAFLAGGQFVLGFGGNPYYIDNTGLDWNPNPLPLPEGCPWAGDIATFTPINICQTDPYGGQMQSRDLRTIHSQREPIYRAKADLFELSLDIDLTDSLAFTSQTVYSRDEYYASQDYNRYATVPIFADSTQACDIIPILDKYGAPEVGTVGEFDCDNPGGYADGFYAGVTAGGVFNDPQLGPSRSLVGQDLSKAESEQFNQEFRLSSNFDAPVNFSLGTNFTRFETMNDYYVFINALSLLTYMFPFNTHNFKWCDTGDKPDAPPCVYVDPNPLESIDGTGHNYFRSANPYELTSSALFGELYWQATETLKVTLGARMTWDQKIFTPIPSQLLLADYRPHVTPGEGPEGCTDAAICKIVGTGANLGEGARGSVPLPDVIQEWREPTGRIIVDWKPDLPFTDETMVYGSVAHGYKGGGANPPNIAPPAGIYNAVNSGVVAPPTFEPEYIDAFEIGTKNTLLDGALILNGSAFYYDYEGYQVSKIVDRSAANENFDAKIWGLELEWIFSPTRNLRFNGTVGHLNTEIGEGERSIDLMNRTLGGTPQTSWIDADGVEHELFYQEWTVLKPFITNSSNCVIPVAIVEAFKLEGSDGDGAWTSQCPGRGVISAGYTEDSLGTEIPGGLPRYNPLRDAPNNGAGFFTELEGNDLPNAPHWTASLGAQYRMPLPGGWDATLRGDFYWQSQSYARVYNTQYDKLRAWTNTNISLWVENPDWGVTAEVYVKNVFDETPITDAFLNSDDSGLTTNVFTLDPRLVGVSVRKQF